MVNMFSIDILIVKVKAFVFFKTMKIKISTMKNNIQYRCTCHYFACPGGRQADPGEFDILKCLKSKSLP
jgi:hypothetical protein